MGSRWALPDVVVTIRKLGEDPQIGIIKEVLAVKKIIYFSVTFSSVIIDSVFISFFPWFAFISCFSLIMRCLSAIHTYIHINF